jgi:hypothetical protein
MQKITRTEFLILFTKNGIDLTDERTREWLRPLAVSGQLLSIDNIRRNEDYPADELDLANFAVINADDREAVNKMLKSCPGINLDHLQIFQVDV